MPMGTWTTGKDLGSGGSFLEDEGWYHFLIISSDPIPKNKDGSLVPNGWLEVKCEVLAGSTPGQEKRTAKFVFKKGAYNHKDQGKFANEKIDRFLYACGLVARDDTEKPVDLDENMFIGCQFVAKVIIEQGQKGGKFPEIAFKQMYHVDDPEVTGKLKLPVESLRHIPASRRLISKREAQPTAAPKTENEFM